MIAGARDTWYLRAGLLLSGNRLARGSGTGRGEAWSDREVEFTVTDYFDMLEAELSGRPYSKSEHRRALKVRLDGRSDGSIEFKHQNISAVLIQMGLPYIDGYKPRGNYQELLADKVRHYLQDPRFLLHLAKGPVLDPPDPPGPPSAPAKLFTPPPDRLELPVQDARPWIERRGQRIDFIERDARNRRLGRMGEQFVVELEKGRLAAEGREDLAGRVEWISKSRGDGIGFDVLSYNGDESERLIEVKTTGLGKYFPFYVTANEVRCSQDCADRFHLYRVYDFAKSPRIYDLQGDLSRSCRLHPVQFMAAI